MKQFQFSEMRNRDGYEAVEDEEQASTWAFRAMEKDLDNITIETINAYMDCYRNGALPPLALKLES